MPGIENTPRANDLQKNLIPLLEAIDLLARDCRRETEPAMLAEMLDALKAKAERARVMAEELVQFS